MTYTVLTKITIFGHVKASEIAQFETRESANEAIEILNSKLTDKTLANKSIEFFILCEEVAE